MSWQEIVIIPWGNGPAAIPAVWVDAPAFSFALEPAGPVPAVPRVRLRDDQITLLNVDGRAIRAGDAVQFTTLSDGHVDSAQRFGVPEAAVRVLDYALDSQGNVIQLLETRRRDATAAYLACTTPAGGVLWQNEDESRAARLLIDDEDNLYVLDDAARELTAVDVRTGRSGARFVQPAGFHKAVITLDGTVISQTYDDSIRRRGMAALHPITGQTDTMVGDKALFGWLLYPIGADTAGNLYAYRPDQKTSPEAVAILRFDGTVAGIRELDDAPWRRQPALRTAAYTAWQVRADGRVCVPAADDHSLYLFELTI